MPFNLIAQMIVGLLASEGIMMGGRALGGALFKGAAEKAGAALAANAAGKAITGGLGRAASAVPWLGKILPESAEAGVSAGLKGLGSFANLGTGVVGGGLVSDALFSQGSSPSPDHVASVQSKDRIAQQAALQTAVEQYLKSMGGVV